MLPRLLFVLMKNGHIRYLQNKFRVPSKAALKADVLFFHHWSARGGSSDAACLVRSRNSSVWEEAGSESAV